MSHADIQRAFCSRAGDALHVDTITVAHSGPVKMLKASGWHADGLPFAEVSAPFTGDPVTRAAQFASDIIAVHTGERDMPAPAPITGLADFINSELTAAVEDAGKLREKAESSVANLRGVLNAGHSMVADVDKATAGLQAALGVQSNNPPSEGNGSA